MKFRLRSVWNEEVTMNDYMAKLQDEGFAVDKIDDPYVPIYHIGVDNLSELLIISEVIGQEIIYYKQDNEWVLEIYDGRRE